MGARGAVALLVAVTASACAAFEAVGIIDEDNPAPAPAADAGGVALDGSVATGDAGDAGGGSTDAAKDAAPDANPAGLWVCTAALRESFADKEACLTDQASRGCAAAEIVDTTPCGAVGVTQTSCTVCIKLGTGEYAYRPSSCRCTAP